MGVTNRDCFSSRQCQVTPLGCDFPRKPLPPVIAEHLFDKDERVDTVLLLDGLKVMHLEERLQDERLEAVCLYDLESGRLLGSNAPWLIKVERHTALLRDMFDEGPMPTGLWRARPGIVLLASEPITKLRSHFRKFTYLRDSAAGMKLFRFWEPSVAYGLVDMSPHIADRIFAPVRRLICPLDRATLGVVNHITTNRHGPVNLDDTLHRTLELLSRNRTCVAIAERLWDRVSGQDWPSFRSNVVRLAEEAMNRYRLTTSKYLEAYLMIRIAKPELFEEGGVNAVLQSSRTEVLKIQQLLTMSRAT